MEWQVCVFGKGGKQEKAARALGIGGQRGGQCGRAIGHPDNASEWSQAVLECKRTKS